MKAIRLIHRWLGAFLALLVALIALSGTVLVHKQTLLHWAAPALDRTISLSAADMGAGVDGIVARYGAGSISAVKLPQPNQAAYEVFLRDSRRLLLAPGDLSVMLDLTPFASIIGTIIDLHIHLLAGESGEVVSGIAGIAVLGFTITGFLLWQPRTFVRGLSPERFDRKNLYLWHQHAGVLMAPLFVLVVAAGVGLVFYTPIATGLDAVAGAETPPQPVQPPSSTPVSIADALPTAQAQFPQARAVYVLPAGPRNGVHQFRLAQPGELHPNGRSMVAIAAASGAVMSTHNALAMPWSRKTVDSFYPIHAAKTGWPGHRILATIAGIWLAAIALAGFVSFLLLQKRRLRRRPSPNR